MLPMTQFVSFLQLLTRCLSADVEPSSCFSSLRFDFKLLLFPSTNWIKTSAFGSHLRPIHWFPLIHFSVLLGVCFELLSCCRCQDLRLQQSSRLNSTFCAESPDNPLISFCPEQIQDTLPPYNITELHSSLQWWWGGGWMADVSTFLLPFLSQKQL